MKILVISQHYWPENFRINEVAESLHRAGCDVRVLTGQPNYPEGVVFPGYRAASVRREERTGITIHRVPVVPRGHGNAWRLAANYLSFLFSACVLGPWLLRGQRVDVIFVYGTSPILQAVAGIVLKFFKRAPLAVWVQDLWPQSLEATGFVRNQRMLGAVGSVVRWIYRRSDLLLAQSKSFVTSVQAMAGDTPVEYHPNPGEVAYQQPLLPGASALQLEPGFNVLFAGNLGKVQSLDMLLDAANLLRAHTDVRFVLIGSGSRSAWLHGEVARRVLPNVSLPGRFGPEAMPAILAQASVLLLSLSRSCIMSQTVPSKLQAYLAAGRPVIASLDGEGAWAVEDSKAGVTCPAEDAPALARAVLQLRAAPPEELRRMGEAGRRYYEHNFDPAMLAGRLIQRFEQLVASCRPTPETD